MKGAIPIRAWLLSGSFFVILGALIAINALVNGRFAIETSWIAVALSPVIIWLVVTGQLTEFSGFGLGFKLREASTKPFVMDRDGESIEPAEIPVGDKGALDMIPELVERRIAALTLQLGRQNYYNDWAISEYLERLCSHDFFRYVVFVDAKGNFHGLAQGRDLLVRMREEQLELVAKLESSDIIALPGVVVETIRSGSNKRDALLKMYEHGIGDLPVVDESGRFVGVVNRDKLTSSILLRLVAQL